MAINCSKVYAVITSTTGFGALRPALQRPLKGIQLLLDDIIAVDGRYRVFMDDVLICQARACVILLRYNLTQTWETDAVNMQATRS